MNTRQFKTVSLKTEVKWRKKAWLVENTIFKTSNRRNAEIRNENDTTSVVVFTYLHPLKMNLNLILVSAIAVINLTLIHSSSVPRKIVVAVDGGTESIRACCFDDCGNIVGKSCAIPYETYHEQPGFAEQDPADWWNNMGQAVRGALASVEEEFELGETTSKEWSFSNWFQNIFGAGESEVEKVDVRSLVAAICIDTTCCSVVVLDENHKPLRKSLLWMDARSAPQTVEIMKKAKGDKALKVNCNGNGPISAEWMTPKCMWIKQNENSLYNKAKYICEYQDYINYKMTGVMCASSCNAAARWHWDGDKCIDTTKDKYAGRPMSLYKKVGMLDLADKLPQVCLPMGSLVGRLTQEAADHLGLLPDTPVAQGGPDAFVGMVGLGCIHSQQLCLITGSSHLHCVVTSKPLTANGSWGAYKGAPLPGINFAEGGQSSTGSLSRWAKKLFGAQELSYKTLDDEAESIAPGSDGLIALETFQGSRTPVTDPLARGALVGLTLSHSRGHIWRALMEAVCLGTRACIDGLESAGHTCSEIIIAGGTTRSPLWLQMHADVTGKPVILCENIDAPLLGCAILACVGCGIHASVEDAVRSMVRVSRRVEPDPRRQVIYDKLYNEVYTKLSPAVRPVVHSISKLRGGGQSDIDLTVSPSILAADWSDMKNEIRKCVDAGLLRIHTDVFDGVYIDSPNALTFGPQVCMLDLLCTKCVQSYLKKVF